MNNKRIVILGSTGSVGIQTLEVARKHGIKTVGLSVGRNIVLAERQIREFKPDICAVFDETAAAELEIKIADTNTRILSGKDGVNEAAAYDCDIVVNAIGGEAGLEPTLSALRAGNTLALSNKESLVIAGDIVTRLADEKNVLLLPVDSEHSAIFQCLNGNNSDLAYYSHKQYKDRIKNIILTASGGPFWGYNRAQLNNIKVREALDHPTWKMGKKITIDSATLMNKGLEVIEAAHLFAIPVENIKVLIHRESVIHSMVEYKDNAIIAQLGTPDMRTCIQYALSYPERISGLTEPLDFAKLAKLTFFEPDIDTFYLLKTAYSAFERGGNIPAVMNAANEAAVELFIEEKIRFTDIFSIVKNITDDYKLISVPALDEILESAAEAKNKVSEDYMRYID